MACKCDLTVLLRSEVWRVIHILTQKPNLTDSVKLEHPYIDGVNFLTLEKLVQEDRDNRYELLYEPYSHSLGTAEHVDQWWIRKSRSLLKPVRRPCLISFSC